MRRARLNLLEAFSPAMVAVSSTSASSWPVASRRSAPSRRCPPTCPARRERSTGAGRRRDGSAAGRPRSGPGRRVPGRCSPPTRLLARLPQHASSLSLQALGRRHRTRELLADALDQRGWRGFRRTGRERASRPSRMPAAASSSEPVQTEAVRAAVGDAALSQLMIGWSGMQRIVCRPPPEAPTPSISGHSRSGIAARRWSRRRWSATRWSPSHGSAPPSS